MWREKYKRASLNSIEIKMNELREIEKVIEWMSNKTKSSFLLLSLCEVNDLSYINLQNVLKDKTFQNLNIILQTPWWDASSAYKIIRLLRTKCQTLNIYVPFFAKSAGTLICLWADNVFLSSIADLGPLDVQLTTLNKEWQPETKSALEEFKALEQIKEANIKAFDSFVGLLSQRLNGVNLKDLLSTANEYVAITSGKLYTEIDPRKLWEYSRALEIWFQYWVKILTTWWKQHPSQAEEIMHKLVYGYPTHSFVIDWEDDLNLPIQYVSNLDDLEALAQMFIQKKIPKLDIIQLFEYNQSKFTSNTWQNE